MESNKILFRSPTEVDGRKVWSLVRDTNVLDLNSSYSYLMLCRFFSDTCLVAEYQNQIVGFISAFRPTANDNTIFVWQVAVDPSMQGKGLGRKLLRELLKQDTFQLARFLETTISPSNKRSQALFQRLAKDLNTNCSVMQCFPSSLFPKGNHEDELLYKIGPFKRTTKEATSDENVRTLESVDASI